MACYWYAETKKKFFKLHTFPSLIPVALKWCFLIVKMNPVSRSEINLDKI